MNLESPKSMQELKEKECQLKKNNNKILLCLKKGVYILPGGKVKEKETDIEALNRELDEELHFKKGKVFIDINSKKEFQFEVT